MNTVHWTAHTIPGGPTTFSYVEVVAGVPQAITAAEFAAKTKIKCPLSETITKDVCLQPTGNTDVAEIKEGCKTYIQTTTFSDLVGTVDTQTQTPTKLFLAGADVTSTHEEVACPVPTVVSGSICVTDA